MATIQFLTQVGQKCTNIRQEFILLSDVLISSTVLAEDGGQAESGEGSGGGGAGGGADGFGVDPNLDPELAMVCLFFF